ncbi:MAG: tetratricopeptide repeat protein [gamma proteobacterium symbiont of Taylorina sp.]|nr:tetratricopeptide repeat protein [gamma proteobacterium symbiont of Taylorina sp.]
MKEQQLNIKQVMSQAKKAKKKGNAPFAMQLYKLIQQHQPNHPVAKKELRRLQKSLKKAQSIEIKKTILSQKRLDYLVSLYHSGDMIKVEKACRETLKIDPESIVVFNLLGAALKRQGNLQGAVEAYDKAIQFKPDYAEAFSNRGIALHELGQLEEAVKSFDKAIMHNPNFSDAYSNKGNVLNELGRLKDAVEIYNKAIHLKPDCAVVYNNKGNALKALGQLRQAVMSYNKAVQLNPYSVEAYYNLGIVLDELGENNEAVESYDKAIQLKPDYVEAYSNLCEIYEKRNMFFELKSLLQRAQEVLQKKEPSILYWRAQFASRENRLEDMRDLLELIVPEKLPQNLKQSYSELLAKTYDKLNLFVKAFAQFEFTNEITRKSYLVEQLNANHYLNRIGLLSKSWSTTDKIKWLEKNTIVKQQSLVFLVGFPRSGTTLLDTILRTHPDVSVVEEKAMVGVMMSHLKELSTPEFLTDLDDEQLDQLRNLYYKELYSHVRLDTQCKLIIDKFPLNIVDAGLIHRVFPDAKFILVLRHPCDCVLSCFMQNFKLNDAMENFLTLEGSAKLYDSVMSLWSEYNRMLDLKLGVIKYEDLIQDLQATTEPLLKFLGLDWDDNLLNYQETALSRGKINTPSYNQVTQKLYTQANGRWKNYHEQMKDVIPLLDPWIEKFGYSIFEQKVDNS